MQLQSRSLLIHFQSADVNTPNRYLIFSTISKVQCPKGTKGPTGYGRVKGKGLQADELFAPGLLHTVTENAFPGVQLEQLDASQ